MPEPASSIRDGRVLALLAAIVVAVLGLNIVSAFVPGLDAALAGLPIVVGVLVGGTLLVLVGAFRRR
ncbi:hypothetical protein BH23CHL8_BH23CHL8_06230 [soil metagenome]